MITQPITRMVSKNKIRLLKPYTFTINGVTYIIPKMYEWDGATIPRILWSITGIDPFGYVNPASIVHDYVYGFEGKMPDGTYIPRQVIDEWFVQTILDLKLINNNFVKLYKQVLRIGGLYFWNDKY